MTEAKPCIVCGKQLSNVADDAENQPSEAVTFRSSGQYGSTVFDPMDGTFIEINVCDECLDHAGELGQVLWGREAKPVRFGGAIVGWCPTPGRPLLDWTGEEPAAWDADDVLDIDEDDLRNMDRLLEVKLNRGLAPEDLLE